MVEDDENKPLNSGLISTSGPESVAIVNQQLLQIIQPLYNEILADHNRVSFDQKLEPTRDYCQKDTAFCVKTTALKKSFQTICYYKLVENDMWLAYQEFSRHLQLVDLLSATDDEKLALLINVYNMMLIHITHKFGPPTSVWQRRKVGKQENS